MQPFEGFPSGNSFEQLSDPTWLIQRDQGLI
jgi:hypothetical protein